MPAVLGVSAYYHDAAAALVVDGNIIAAVQEERLSRIKNDPSLPLRAIRACLKLGNLPPEALDAVVFYESPFDKLERVLVSILRTFPRSFRQFPRALGAQLGNKMWVLDQLAEHLNIPRERVSYRSHHESHAASAFFPSPFPHAAILTVDGVGEDITTAIWEGRGNTLRCLSSLRFPHSLGLLYAALTAWLGFEINEGEYKVMGLASFGKPRFREEFAKLVHQEKDGSFSLALDYFAHHTDTELGFGPKLEALLGPRRQPRKPWDLSTDEDRRRADVAATLQEVTEEVLLGLARRARELTGADALCLAGGVALNAVANARLLKETGFTRLFVQPAAGDAGGALGAAILGALAKGDKRPGSLTSAALGLPLDVARLHALAVKLGLTVEKVSDPPAEIAKELCQGRVVALAEGRFEWGPRALGQRSLLAAPGHPETRDRINRAVKHREPFRPFAPAVLADEAGALFDGAPNDMTPFMTTVCPVLRPERLGAVTHVDGTARVQTVTHAAAPRFAAVLEAMGKETGLPVVLNTSLNGAGEPIVGGAEDALAFLLSHSIDALYAEDVRITGKRR